MEGVDKKLENGENSSRKHKPTDQFDNKVCFLDDKNQGEKPAIDS